jgi:5-methyltetrahydropteroyltriglutamate--homocysteine methyltransferase
MMTTPQAPFRADQVGSLLRPKGLLDARDEARRGAITADQLRAAEDDAIRRAVAMQEAAGMQAITDGEYRRATWHVDFLTGISGITATRSNYAVSFKDEGGEVAATGSMLTVTGKLARPRPIALADFDFLKSLTGRTAKVCLPSATYLHLRGGRKVVPPEIYPDIEEFWSDLARVYEAEIADLAAAGCRYVQIDDVSFAFLCDPAIRAQIRHEGENPDALPKRYAQAINQFIAGRPPGVTITIHTCRGNHRSMWMAEGAYDAIAEAVFGTIAVDGFFLEFDSERSGGFAPLRYVPRGRKVVLGLVSTKTTRLESKDDLKRRIDEAARYVPLEDLCLSPQCGFASTALGNKLTEDDERRKLELVVEVAQEVWGTS